MIFRRLICGVTCTRWTEDLDLRQRGMSCNDPYSTNQKTREHRAVYSGEKCIYSHTELGVLLSGLIKRVMKYSKSQFSGPFSNAPPF